MSDFRRGRKLSSDVAAEENLPKSIRLGEIRYTPLISVLTGRNQPLARKRRAIVGSNSSLIEKRSAVFGFPLFDKLVAHLRLLSRSVDRLPRRQTGFFIEFLQG